MINEYHSPLADPRDRGASFGEHWRERVRDTIEGYRELFSVQNGSAFDIEEAGGPALVAIRGWAPELATEIEGIAAGAGVSSHSVAAINARTEIIARFTPQGRGECSTAVLLGGERPITVQTWDWHDRFEDNWLVWTIELPNDRTVVTMTEFGIVGKIGVNNVGLGVHLNFLRHRSDRAAIGVPVHIVARRVLDEATNMDAAMGLVRSAAVSASSALTIIEFDGKDSTAVVAELFPEGPAYVLPEPDGVLVHTNHFVHPTAAIGDLEPALGGDSYFRYEMLRRRLAATPPASRDSVIAALNSHLGGGGALCCHPDPAAGIGARYATLATVAIDLKAGRLDVREGGPCLASESTILRKVHA
jgi:isopenicillin-N N-acyltransferase-like protein